ncbi:MAG: hypothetical protein HC837_10370 [Chloroflexaceae bacterium]|nr:hypothetical protein [Chloroflexaceae bacterium]
MPYELKMHSTDLLWIVVSDPMNTTMAESYFNDVWQTLDTCPCMTDLLVDARGAREVNGSVRQRTEQVIHHAHLGHIAFVVGQAHLLWLAPLVRLVSGVGLFGNEHEAVAFLHKSRSLPPLHELKLPNLPEHPFVKGKTVAHPTVPATHKPGRNGTDHAPIPAVAPITPPSSANQHGLRQPVRVATANTPVRNAPAPLPQMPERPERRRKR